MKLTEQEQAQLRDILNPPEPEPIKWTVPKEVDYKVLSDDERKELRDVLDTTGREVMQHFKDQAEKHNYPKDETIARNDRILEAARYLRHLHPDATIEAIKVELTGQGRTS